MGDGTDDTKSLRNMPSVPRERSRLSESRSEKSRFEKDLEELPRRQGEVVYRGKPKRDDEISDPGHKPIRNASKQKAETRSQSKVLPD